jgi:hypothetical protein
MSPRTHERASRTVRRVAEERRRRDVDQICWRYSPVWSQIWIVEDRAVRAFEAGSALFARVALASG